MTKYYLIIPCVLLAVFLIFERSFQRERIAAEAIRATQVAAAKAAEETRLAELRRKTAEDTRLRVAQREKEERDRAEKKRREAEAALHVVETEADAHAAEAARLARETDALDRQLAELRTQKQRAQATAFALVRHVEERRIDRRNADLEIQRTTKMVAARLLESPWANPAPATPAPVVPGTATAPGRNR